MGVTVMAYWLLLAAVGLLRLGELRLSRRNQRRLMARGARLVPDPSFPWMVALHTGMLLAAAGEVVLLQRPLIWPLAAPMLALFLAANAGRWWVIRTLGEGWTVRVMTVSRQGVAVEGPFRWIRHPNYACVFVEMAVLPLIHTAWLTALIGSCAHVLVLRERLRVEESVLLANSMYRDQMSAKPCFLPRALRPRTGMTE